MQTFEAQVEALTSLSIDSSSSPNQTELSDFLSDGAMEVINAMPKNLKYQCATEDTFTSTAFGSETSDQVLTSSEILSVTRVNEFCRKISAEQALKASDSSAFASSNMEKATATDPVWYIYNGKINALPASGACKYLEVNRPSVAYNHTAMSTSLASFPLEYEYLIPLYASLKSLQNAMGSKSSSLPSDITLPSVPVVPSINTVSYTDATNADATIDAIVVPAKIDVSSDAPTFVSPVSPSADFAKVTSYIETDEDVELASSKIQQINTQISDFNAKLQEAQNVFNKENIKYQTEFQEEVTKVNQDLQAELERFRANSNLAQFNKQQDQALNLANAAKQMEDIISDNNSKLQQYSSELQKYQGQVSSEIQNFNAKIQKQVTNYQWLTSQYQQLSMDYQRGLQLLRGVPTPQQEQRR